MYASEESTYFNEPAAVIALFIEFSAGCYHTLSISFLLVEARYPLDVCRILGNLAKLPAPSFQF
jgi:hypothetical protein